jgi:WD40 repeat protein
MTHNTVNIWDINTGAMCATFNDASSIAAFSHDDEYIAVHQMSGIRLCATRVPASYKDFEDCHEAAFAPEGKIFATIASYKKIQLWDYGSGVMASSILDDYNVHSLVFSSSGLLLASISNDVDIKVWDVRTGTMTCSFSSPVIFLLATASLTGKLFAAACYDGTIKLWDTDSGQLEKVHYLGSMSPKLSFSSDGKHLHNSLGKLAVDTSMSYKASYVHAEPCWQFAFN